MSIQDGFKMLTNQFAYLCMCQNHAGTVDHWLAYIVADALLVQEDQANLCKGSPIPDTQVSFRCQFLSAWHFIHSFIHSWLTSLVSGF
jgi:hypothetical protein